MTKVLGKFTKDVELRRIDINGENRLVLNNSIAIRNSSGKKDDTTFLDITAWNGVAELIAKYLTKGEMVLLTGEIRSKSREIEGKKYTSHFLLVEKIEFVGGNKNRKDTEESMEDDYAV